MDAEETTPGDRPTSARMRLVAVLGAAALAAPGGFAIGNAFAADGAGTPTPATQQAPADPGFAPVQETTPEEQPRDEDCPEKDGAGSGSGSDSGSGAGTAPTAL
jgi:hypothetical protein